MLPLNQSTHLEYLYMHKTMMSVLTKRNRHILDDITGLLDNSGNN